VLYWNAIHGWVSFKFQLDRPPQLGGWSARYLGEFIGQQFALVGVLLFPIVVGAAVMLAMRRASATAGRCSSGPWPLPAPRST
jgi:hypothetical protein